MRMRASKHTGFRTVSGTCRQMGLRTTYVLGQPQYVLGHSWFLLHGSGTECGRQCNSARRASCAGRRSQHTLPLREDVLGFASPHRKAWVSTFHCAIVERKEL